MENRISVGKPRAVIQSDYLIDCHQSSSYEISAINIKDSCLPVTGIQCVYCLY